MRFRRLPSLVRAFWRIRIKPYWQTYELCALAGLALLSFALGFVGSARIPREPGAAHSWLDDAYRSLQLFVLEGGEEQKEKNLEFLIARVLSPLVSAYTGMKVLAAILRDQIRAFGLWLRRDHVIICGLGRKGLQLARGFHDQGESVLVIEHDRSNPFLDLCEELGVEVIVGDAKRSHILRRAGADRARILICVCGEDEANAEIVAKARTLLLARRGAPVSCFVHIVDPDLCRLLREYEFGAGGADRLRLEFFNVYDSGARMLLSEIPFPEDGTGRSSRLVVVGAGRMGQSLIFHSARQWWMAHKGEGERPRIAIVDRLAQKKAQSLHALHPRLREACVLEPFDLEIEESAFLEARFLYDAEGRPDAAAVHVCVDNNSLGLKTGLALLRHARPHKIPVVIRLTNDAGLTTLLRCGEDAAGFDPALRSFPLFDRTCRPESILGGVREDLARAVHEVYLRTQAAAGQTREANPHFVPWEDLPEDIREANRAQVDHISVKLQAVRCRLASLTDWFPRKSPFTDEEVERLAEMEHERYVDFLRAAGWTYAPAPKDRIRKTNPCICGWEQLSAPMQEIDRDAVRALPEILARAGLEIRRLT
ncbi:MAG: NAD-binding protein [Planctomycetes bacterium]|nr:NAD-binding protein [Planctomycetota bacterium]